MSLLVEINNMLLSIPGATTCESLPQFNLSSDLLSKEKVFLLDDSVGVFEIYLPALMLATEGNTDFLCHSNVQSLSDVISIIEHSAPSLVLIDFYLAGSLRGTDVCQELSQSFPEIKLFGFSSIGRDPKIKQAFLNSGAIASIQKTKDCSATLEDLLGWLQS
ncbi:MAG: hypothetical protein R3A13_07180 [Bdellovibrionota bacterium]